MGLKERLQKIKREKPWVLPEEEKTGVINGLILIGAISSAFFAMQKEINAEPTDSTSTCETGASSANYGVDYDSWQNHCWWNHCWTSWSSSGS